MKLMKFKSADHYVYINTENIVGIEPALIDNRCTTIYTTGEKKFVVNGSCDEVASIVAGDTVRDILNRSANIIDTGMPKMSDYYDFKRKEEKRCGLCKHYEVGSHRQCRKHFEDRAEDDKPCYYYDTNRE